jgi:hypothetical protein
MKKLILAVAVPVLCSLSFAGSLHKPDVKPQQEANAALLQQKTDAAKALPLGPLSTDDCSFTFTSGTNLTGLVYCVTANGNIPELQSPLGQPLVSFNRAEGYGVCDTDSGVAYSDYGGAGDSGNWNPAAVGSHSATSVKITRTTSDGIWTLTQTITQVASASSVKVVMVLKNNTAMPRGAFLVRFADADAAGVVLNNFDGTKNSVLGWNSASSNFPPFGLVLQALNRPSDIEVSGIAQSVPNPPDPCNPFANFVPGRCFRQMALCSSSSFSRRPSLGRSL